MRRQVGLSAEAELPFRSIYFGGAAWGCAYFIGIVRAFELRFGANWATHVLITGDSAVLVPTHSPTAVVRCV